MERMVDFGLMCVGLKDRFVILLVHWKTTPPCKQVLELGIFQSVGETSRNKGEARDELLALTRNVHLDDERDIFVGKMDQVCKVIGHTIICTIQTLTIPFRLPFCRRLCKTQMSLQVAIFH